MDITEQVRAQEAVQSSEFQLKSILGASPVGVELRSNCRVGPGSGTATALRRGASVSGGGGSGSGADFEAFLSICV